MATLKLVAIIALLSASALAKSVNPALVEEAGPEYGTRFEGDMILNAEQMDAVTSRNGIIDTKYRWPNKTLVYEMTGNHTKEQQLYIKMAHWAIESVSCIRFVPRTNESKYVYYQNKSDGCYSEVGFMDTPQVLNLIPYPLGKGCFRLGTVVHEHLHALGFYHMQSDHDRDEYVQIKWDNIIAGMEENFEKYNSSVITNFNTTYDYDSILHYGAYGFAKNKTLPTIVPLDESYLTKIGQRTHLSDADIVKLNAMYECDGEHPAPDNFAKKAFEWEKQMNQN